MIDKRLVLFRIAAFLCTVAILLPVTHSRSTGGDFMAGLFSGDWYGYELLLFAFYLLPTAAVVYAALFVAQIVLAFKKTFKLTFNWKLFRLAYVLYSGFLMFILVASFIPSMHGDKLLPGFYIY